MSEHTSEPPISPCRGCGAAAPVNAMRPWTCPDCGPIRCPDCGEPDDRYCSCWISLEGMAMADIKGLLALGDLSVETPKGGR